ncbi:MAG: hypothetical protein M3362_01445 [Acidobacteriota bacterium]|nr:hypothetical protein [Acidobacteriota bacterium]
MTLLRRYATASKHTYFEISIQDVGGVPGSPEADEFGSEFERNLSERLTKVGFRIVQLRRMAKDVYEMEAWSPRAGRSDFLHNLERGVIRNGRSYVMGCSSLLPRLKVDKGMCRRFFDSFRITGVPR